MNSAFSYLRRVGNKLNLKETDKNDCKFLMNVQFFLFQLQKKKKSFKN